MRLLHPKYVPSFARSILLAAAIAFASLSVVRVLLEAFTIWNVSRAHYLCRSIARSHECPDVLTLPGEPGAARDAWGRDYSCHRSTSGRLEIVSLGRDGEVGGIEAADRDVRFVSSGSGPESVCTYDPMTATSGR